MHKRSSMTSVQVKSSKYINYANTTIFNVKSAEMYFEACKSLLNDQIDKPNPIT